MTVTRQQIMDQVLHFAAALLILSIFALGTLWAGALAGLSLGLIRELTEAGGARIAFAEIAPHFAKRDPWIDLAFWTLGGTAAAGTSVL